MQSKVDVTFWSALGDLKLHRLKLEEGPEPLRASWSPSNHAELPGMLTVSAASLAGQPGAEGSAAAAGAPLAGAFPATGSLYVLNTMERLASFDRKAAVAEVCVGMWAAIHSGAAERKPSLLLGTVLLAYCDLKHYKYRYWFAVPALQPPQPFTLTATPTSMQQALGEQAADLAAAACSDHLAAVGQPAWLVAVGGGGEVEAAPLTDWHRLQQGGVSGGQRRLYLTVADSSSLAEHPGWPLRNLLLLAAARWGCRQLGVLCLRERRGRFDAAASLALAVALPDLPPGFCPAPLGGWESNERGKLGPRGADLGPAMDPRLLAESAVDLNLRLMRWRAAPSLDVGAIAATRCLLLGAGTLGCSVARTLLGWGVRHITLVDNSRVAYSNPVRQSLYCFEDCLEGGKPKAAAAADALRRIFPGAVARGVQLSIPMPGHPIADGELAQARRDIAALEALVGGHDVVFLLMDTRESRWLPTLLCAALGRLAINAALGFDGFMVMRHGAPVPPEAEQLPGGGGSGVPAAAPRPAPPPPSVVGSRLGCYFCNDVVAPINSTVDRTLDQQCTVARPGLSAIAGSLAAELMAAVVQQPAGAGAPAAGSPPAAAQQAAAGGEAPPLGHAPHMIRGQLGGFTQMCLTGQAFRQCTACSEAVVREYRRRGHDFLVQGLLDPKHLEDLTGLTELHRASEAALEAWASSDDEEGELGGVYAGAGAGSSLGEQRGAPTGAQPGAAAAEGEEDWEEL
ncbi:hypothetical protein CHLNCDRAFT_37099 [Chlorella variabilis]|uniref:Ubiquitin-like modifier-activating enzyme ATG7 n=1 Tax=Chlorella variabilis TaxID=554065 RepID=E1ZQC0_CHLVA|nr:hypothetical protein CHLNCDRAFT_37099 [Chlorella variabilis]EFN52000.1 hypothetical protein CHLNCDRAFT_37099 [Chlorella variabilis]|eukprot:XP_005844102.1 hypothetical protein CHLNCDRAFT_37099 [Chlorella variabilis]